jgi:hypothetical protein
MDGDIKTTDGVKSGKLFWHDTSPKKIIELKKNIILCGP